MVKVPEIVKQLNRDQVVIKYGDEIGRAHV